MGVMVGVGRKVNEERARSALFGRKVNEERVRSARHGTKILVARHGFGGLPAVADGSITVFHVKVVAAIFHFYSADPTRISPFFIIQI